MTLDRDARSSEHIPPRLDLPVPRLELVYEIPERGGHYRAMWYYRLVLRHLEGYAYCLDIATTGTSDEAPLRHYRDGKGIIGPFRSGVQITYDARQLGIPAYLVVGAAWEEVPPYDAQHYATVTARPIRQLDPPEEEENG